MLQARLNLITGDRFRWGDVITFVEDQVRPAVESLHGSLGLFLAANRERAPRCSSRSERPGRR